MYRHFRSGILISLCAFFAGVCSAQAEDAPIASGQRSDGKVRVDMLSLKHTEGDTVTLRFALVNESNQTVTLSVSLVKLIDLVGRQAYSPGVQSETCHADSGARTICWAVFAAPPPNTKSINVKFYDDFDLVSTPIGK